MKHEPVKFWNYLSEKAKPVYQMKVSNVIINDKKHAAEEFNLYFQPVFSNTDLNTPVATTVHSKKFNTHNCVNRV